VILIDRLVTAAAVLEEDGIRLPDEPIEARLRYIASALAEWRQAVLGRRWPKIHESFDVHAPVPDVPPMLLETERVLHLVSKAENSVPDELKGFPLIPKGGALVADAFKNPEYIHFAVKGALAAFICYLIFTLTAYQAIYTSVITCIVCSLS